MNKRVLFLGALLSLAFSLPGISQTRLSRLVSIRRAQPMIRVPVYGPMMRRVPLPLPPVYYSGPANSVTIINAQNVNIFRSRSIREYPSSYTKTQTIPVNNLCYQAMSSYGITTENYSARIQNIENRLGSLESLASQIRSKLENSPSGSAVFGDYNQRLVRLEEQMQALRDVLVELRNYLASKK